MNYLFSMLVVELNIFKKSSRVVTFGSIVNLLSKLDISVK